MKIIMYHYVREPDAAFPFFTFLHKDDFARQLDYFQSTGTILSPRQVFDAVKGQPVPDGYVLTFDDGLKDHFDYVLPELKKRRLEAFFFVSTGCYTKKKMLDVHKAHLLLGKLGGKAMLTMLQQIVTPHMISKEHEIQYQHFLYGYQVNDEATVTVKRWINFLIADEYRQPVLDELMKACHLNEQEWINKLYLNKAELQQMQNSGMVIGSHTENHPVLSKLSTQLQELEMDNSCHYLEQEAGIARPDTFCYPYGTAETFTNETEALLNKKGFACSFMVDPRDVTATDCQWRPQALPRYDCNMFPHGQIWK